jgi:hypothetical protein
VRSNMEAVLFSGKGHRGGPARWAGAGLPRRTADTA